MKLTVVVIITCLAIMTGAAKSQELIVTDFPLGIGSSVSDDFFKPYYPRLQQMADVLNKNTYTRAIITGGSDGQRYKKDNDAKNPALALGRAHALRQVLISIFGVDSTQIVIRTEDVKTKGARYRYVSVRLDNDLSSLSARLDTVEQRPPIEKQFIESQTLIGDTTDNVGLRFSAGFTSSPFGGIPIVSVAMTWKQKIIVEGMVGHTFWNSSYDFQSVDLDTKRRLTGGRVTVFPFDDLKVGVVAGWVHIEEISQQYYEYVRLSEGPLIGVRAFPFEFLSVMAAYNPSRQRVSSIKRSTAENDQFIVSATLHFGFGGGK